MHNKTIAIFIVLSGLVAGSVLAFFGMYIAVSNNTFLSLIITKISIFSLIFGGISFAALVVLLFIPKRKFESDKANSKLID